ncbi:hypothetical protein G7Y89_g5819 [Cudoniella acicularis]|uniref:YDG domain-containing protein n=1 Tax=Cudoniella acicularis TaxID=354080 RepID=A0A8H4RQ01_9HELO|nr:hypothetical protein G7Y89_g5819 [Cudoniella acicularis]
MSSPTTSGGQSQSELASISGINSPRKLSSDASPRIDPRELVADSVDYYLSQNGEPDFNPAFIKTLKDNLTLVAMKLKSGRNIEQLTDEHMDKVLLFLYWVAQNKKPIAELHKEHNVRGCLLAIEDTRNNMPEDCQIIAKGFREEFEAINWGVPVEPEVPDEPKAKTRTKRARVEEKSALPKPKAAKVHNKDGKTEKPACIIRARDDHKIFGLHGIMHHIVMSVKKSKIWVVDKYEKKDFRVFGHNGLEVGMCWPMRVAAMRDGAHGAPVAGISGTAAEGCYSIVVSGEYDDVDVDNGDTLHYSTANAHDPKDILKPTVDKQNPYTQSLIRSSKTKKPVRVLRTSKSGWNGRPAKGVRYDGLYTVVKYEQKTNLKGGLYLSFFLKRNDNQPPIDRSRPTFEEGAIFDKVKDGF